MPSLCAIARSKIQQGQQLAERTCSEQPPAWNQTTPFGMCVLLSPDNITMLVKSAEACILTRNVPNLSLEEFRQSQLLHAVRSKAAPTVEHPQLWFTWQLVRGAFLAAQDTSVSGTMRCVCVCVFVIALVRVC